MSKNFFSNSIDIFLLWAFVLSILIHFSLISPIVFYQKYLLSKMPMPVEVTYQEMKIPPKGRKEDPAQNIKIVKESKVANDVEILSRGADAQWDQNIEDISKWAGDLKIDKQLTPPMDISDMDRRVVLPELKTEKITNLKYLSYNSTLRQRIRQRAFAYLQNSIFEVGEVYVTFVLSKDGGLQEIKIIEDKTSASAKLRDIAVKSIRDSSPFPAFPQGFDYPEFTFNLLISFRK